MSDKVNITPRQKAIKSKLEELGHSNVKVWWEKIIPAVEMGGFGGGFMFSSNEESIAPLGISVMEAMETAKEYYDRKQV